VDGYRIIRFGRRYEPPFPAGGRFPMSTVTLRTNSSASRWRLGDDQQESSGDRNHACAEHKSDSSGKADRDRSPFLGGRVIYGIGRGWLREESEILGCRFSARWSQTVEFVRRDCASVRPAEASFAGKYVNFPAGRSYPKPRRQAVHRY